MAPISATKVGLVLGVLFGGLHLLWSVLVAIHLAQPIVDFIFWMHFIKPNFVVEGFSFGRAAILVAVTTAAGFAFGYCASFLWNQLYKPIWPRNFS